MLEVLIKGILYFLLGMCITICSAWIDQHYWEWFIMPYWNVAALSVRQCIGISMFSGLFTGSIILAFQTRKLGVGMTFGCAVIMLCVQLVSGMIWHSFL